MWLQRRVAQQRSADSQTNFTSRKQNKQTNQQNRRALETSTKEHSKRGTSRELGDFRESTPLHRVVTIKLSGLCWPGQKSVNRL
jgi:hypothetical protein